MTVTFDAAASAQAGMRRIVITSNDRDHPTIGVSARLTVVHTQPYVFYNNSAWDGLIRTPTRQTTPRLRPIKRLCGRATRPASLTTPAIPWDQWDHGGCATLPEPTPVLSATEDFSFRMGNSTPR